MWLLIGFLLFAALAAGDVARLHELADTRQFFLLREALQQPGWKNADTLFYRGMVESRFGQEPNGINDLTRFLASHPSADLQRKAYEELAAALGRQGRYGEAARNVTEALRLTPPGERTDIANTQEVFAALAGTPSQSVTFGK